MTERAGRLNRQALSTADGVLTVKRQIQLQHVHARLAQKSELARLGEALY
jgi:hypothetical protein